MLSVLLQDYWYTQLSDGQKYSLKAKIKNFYLIY